MINGNLFAMTVHVMLVPYQRPIPRSVKMPNNVFLYNKTIKQIVK